ncbi:MAG: 4Fe-4S cluster-binding domain-containing protein [Bacteroidaceae bacterium]|nr:4Fe-4S cluster-binding domain-containing protein [Bacteroidaceae bacterium]MBQ9295313.1 4Fe-4S cluster-binding domain-containing protein [Bacteroidaceae bacterium]
MITTSSIYKTTRICSLTITHGCNLHCVYCFEKHKDIGQRMMSIETAKSILKKEFDQFANSGRRENERFAVEFFGGEPLLNFKLIREIHDWVKTLELPFPMMFQMTTNGTLFTSEVLEWFTNVKNDFRVVVSIDGDDLMQAVNRGCSTARIPMEYIARNWPNSYFKMTVSNETLPNYAHGIIELTKQGYRVPSSLAEGTTWSQKEAGMYKQELMKIGAFYLDNPQYKVEQPFDLPFEKLMYESPIPPKNCGVGTNTEIYDTDGKVYPCHLFLPIVHGSNLKQIIEGIDFRDDASLIDDLCLKCPIVKLCRTCYGYNQKDRGSVAKRDLRKCKMVLAELQVVSSFQIQYYLQRKDTLTKEDRAKLDAAIRAYELTHTESLTFE